MLVNPKCYPVEDRMLVFWRTQSYSPAKEYLARTLEQQKEDGLEVNVRWSELLDYVRKQLDTKN